MKIPLGGRGGGNDSVFSRHPKTFLCTGYSVSRTAACDVRRCGAVQKLLHRLFSLRCFPFAAVLLGSRRKKERQQFRAAVDDDDQDVDCLITSSRGITLPRLSLSLSLFPCLRFKLFLMECVSGRYPDGQVPAGRGDSVTKRRRENRWSAEPLTDHRLDNIIKHRWTASVGDALAPFSWGVVSR